MARYTGPRVRVSRRFGIPIFGPSKYLERRNYPPGVHGPKGARRKSTDYGLGLLEKQKLRYYYGLLERQFRNYYTKATGRPGATGTVTFTAGGISASGTFTSGTADIVKQVTVPLLKSMLDTL